MYAASKARVFEVGATGIAFLGPKLRDPRAAAAVAVGVLAYGYAKGAYSFWSVKEAHEQFIRGFEQIRR